MSRFVPILFALLATAAMILPAHASLPENFERPNGHRHAINALLGDVSYHEKYGTFPLPDTTPHQRVRVHLDFVHELLSSKDTSAMPEALREERQRNLARLRDYIDAGQFPRNRDYNDQNRPCFIDDEGAICAVGYLVEQSAGLEMAERINERFQYEFLWRMEMPGLGEWVAASGLSLVELCMIQPCYEPEFNVVIEQDAGRAPATVSIEGYVFDTCGCDSRYVVFDLGDGTVWRSPQYNSYVFSIDIQHIYTQPGVYTITGVATSAAHCGNLTGTDTWQVTLAAPGFALLAVNAPDGSGYTIYLRTEDDIRISYLSQATVDWGDGENPQDAGWYTEESGYRTPAHTYGSAEEREVLVTHRYDGPMGGFVETSTVMVGASQVAATPTTWGAIKSLYR